MAKLKLSYLDFHGGRGEPARLALAIGGVAFEDDRIPLSEGGRYFAGNELSVADLKVSVWIGHLKSGKLDHIPTDLPDRVAPKLVEHHQRVQALPEIRAYYAKHGVRGRVG